MTTVDELQGPRTQYGLLPEVLRWLDGQLRPSWQTLETGCGNSTVVFARNGTQHTCISPFASEHDQVISWCEQHAISTESVRFLASPSEEVLPTLQQSDLDLVLIDGSHSFPQAFIDWFFAARMLNVGGILIVDDVHVWTGAVLRDFLAMEPGWELIQEWLGRSVAFRKTAPLDPMPRWIDQPYLVANSYDGRRIYLALVRRRQFATIYQRLAAAVRRRLN